MIWNHSKFLKGRLTAASAMLEFQTQNSCFARSQHASSWTPAQSAAEPNSNHFHAKSQRSVFKGGAARGAGALRGPARRGRRFPRGPAGCPRRGSAPSPRGGGTGAAGSLRGGGSTGLPSGAAARGRGLAAALARGAGGLAPAAEVAPGCGRLRFAAAAPRLPAWGRWGVPARPAAACAAALAGSSCAASPGGRAASGLAGRHRLPPEENGRSGSAVPARAAAAGPRSRAPALRCSRGAPAAARRSPAASSRGEAIPVASNGWGAPAATPPSPRTSQPGSAGDGREPAHLPRPTAAGDSPCIRGIPRGGVRRALRPPHAGREGVWWPGGRHRAGPASRTRVSPARPSPVRRGSPSPRCPCSSPHTAARPLPCHRSWGKGSEKSFPRDRSTFLRLHLMGLSEHFYLLTGKKPRSPDAVPGLWFRVLEWFHFLSSLSCCGVKDGFGELSLRPVYWGDWLNFLSKNGRCRGS